MISNVHTGQILPYEQVTRNQEFKNDGLMEYICMCRVNIQLPCSYKYATYITADQSTSLAVATLHCLAGYGLIECCIRIFECYIGVC